MASVFLICITLLLVSTDRLPVYAQLADVINTYGINYYMQNIDPNQNTITSGYAVAIIKTMLLAGARTVTEQSLRTDLGYDAAGLTDAQVLSSYNQILTTQMNHNSAYTLVVANSLWTQTGFTILPDYKTTLANSFSADENDVDFTRSSANAAIKRWVTNVTQGQETNLFRGFASNQHDVVLINALYFNGRMNPQFDRRQLRRRAFTEYNGVTQRTRQGLMVGTTNMYNYTFSQALNADVLELPYNGKEVSMYILLPRSVTGLPNLELNLTLPALQSAMGALKTSKVAISMPFIADFNRVGTLSYLALQELDGVDDDLSGISGQQNLFESEEDQNDRFSYGLDSISFRGKALRGPPDVTFTANHPFLFYLRHKPTDIILFMGRLIRPLGNGIL